MNIDLLFPALTGDLTKLPQADQTGSEGAGQEFEDMLVQQSKAQQGESHKKPEDKKAPEKPEQKSTQEDEAAEEGGELAAALVTSQPVVPIVAFEASEVKVSEDGTVIIEPAMAEETAEIGAAQVVETAEVQPEIEAPKEQPAEAQFQPEAEAVEEAPKEEQPKVQAQAVTEDTSAKAADKPEVTVRRAQAQDRPQDEEPDADVEQVREPLFRDVKSAPVKVAEAQRPVDAEEPEAPQQLANNVMRAVEQGQDVVRVQLNPANLGSVTIELSRDAAGQLTIVMNPETARAASILNANTGSLMANLVERGENVAQIQVIMPEESENAGMMMDPDGHNGQAGENEDGRKKKHEDRAGGVNAADFLSQLRLGLVDAGRLQ